ncbi:hypothetical protein POM88_001470 [Heracleum sosnowskyi]|uniref:Alcohol dehydrogenase-like N-terminal domain-containing protein n=1 Tax=Heracleum sosnowskyi TaxID=360622 RepID=A0AAD8N509_9APIA|nr:hypothetical protein POM88_001470 [Heracleum sosnowskyi]
MIIRHECSGIVEEIRREVKDLVSGDRVALEPGISCWRCCQCKQGWGSPFSTIFRVLVALFRCFAMHFFSDDEQIPGTLNVAAELQATERTMKVGAADYFSIFAKLEKVKTEKKRPAAVHGGPMTPAKAGRLTNAYVSSFPAPPTFVRSPSHSPYPATGVPQYQVSPPMYGHGSRSPPAGHYV